MNTRPFHQTITLTHTAGGAGSNYVDHVLLRPVVSGKLYGVQLRRDNGDTITTDVVPYWVNGGTYPDGGSVAPVDDTVVAKASAITLTASATAASLDSDFDNPRTFVGGLNLAGLFTFSGAGTSTIYATIWGEVSI